MTVSGGWFAPTGVTVTGEPTRIEARSFSPTFAWSRTRSKRTGPPRSTVTLPVRAPAAGAQYVSRSASRTNAAPLPASDEAAVVIDGSAGWPDLAAAAAALPLSPLVVRFAPDPPCGAHVPFTLSVGYEGGIAPETFPLILVLGAPGAFGGVRLPQLRDDLAHVLRLGFDGRGAVRPA